MNSCSGAVLDGPGELVQQDDQGQRVSRPSPNQNVWMALGSEAALSGISIRHEYSASKG
jgi:hypothetical protein